MPQKTAEKAGDVIKARQYNGKEVAIAGNADKTRADVENARVFLARPS